jgi:hypothetical protein
MSDHSARQTGSVLPVNAHPPHPLAAAGTLLLSRLPADAAALVGLLPGLLLTTAALGAGFVVATTTAMAHIDHDQAGLTSGLLNTGHKLGASGGGGGLHDRRRQSHRHQLPAYVNGPRGTRLTNTVDIRPASGALRLLAPLAASRVKAAVAANLDTLKQHLEAGGSACRTRQGARPKEQS